jgi:nucleoside-diphosphate-sugar epimerase
MKIFLAGAGGAIGRRLTPLLRSAGHAVFGTTRAADKAGALRALGAEPVVIDVFDAQALARAVQAAAPDVVLHQLTDLAFAPGTPQYEEGLARNARLRIEGTRNLADAAKAAGVRRMITQSIAFVYEAGVARGCGCGGGAACREQRQARHLQHRGRRRRDLE